MQCRWCPRSEFHLHATLGDVLESLFEDGIAADEGCGEADHTDLMKWLPKVEPNHCGSKRDKHHTEDVDQFRTMFVIVMIMMVIAVVTIVGMGKLRQVNPCFGDLAEIFRAAGFFSNRNSVSKRSVEISLDDSDQFLCGLKLRSVRLGWRGK